MYEKIKKGEDRGIIIEGRKNMDFKNSKTHQNLMRAFAGESQARNRYTFAAEFAKEHGLYVVSDVFLFTADQERAHAKVFYDHLKELTGENLNIDAEYPVEVYDTMDKILEAAKHDEYSEYEKIYKDFEEIAREEGYDAIAASFKMIAKIEKVHGDRFGEFLKAVKEDKMFRSDGEIYWFCTNCGHIHYADSAPEQCPVCKHPKGYFIKEGMIPYTEKKIITM